MKMKQISFIVVIAAAVSTVVIGVKTTNYPISAGALGFIGWAVSPYFYLAVMAKLVSRRAATIVVAVVAFLVGGFGVWAFIDTMFIHPDAQGGLAFIVVPMWQWTMLLLATLPVYLLNKVKSEA